MGLHGDQPTRPRDRRVLRGHFVEPQAQKAPQRQGVGSAPGDPALGIDTFEVPDQQQPEIGARRQARATHPVRIERGALAFHEHIKAMRVEHLVQPLIERMAARRWQFVRGNPQPRRPCAVRASTHRHAGSVVRGIDPVDALTLTTGC